MREPFYFLASRVYSWKCYFHAAFGFLIILRVLEVKKISFRKLSALAHLPTIQSNFFKNTLSSGLQVGSFSDGIEECWVYWPTCNGKKVEGTLVWSPNCDEQSTKSETDAKARRSQHRRDEDAEDPRRRRTAGRLGRRKDVDMLQLWRNSNELALL